MLPIVLEHRPPLLSDWRRILAEGALWVSIGSIALASISADQGIAQTALGVRETPPSFDVASIRENKADGPSRTSEYHSADTWKLTYANTPLIYFLQKAYGVKDYQISGPDWMKSRKYDILATGPYKPDDNDGWQPMLQDLLAVRFQLKLHRETRRLPIYALMVGKKGPKLKEAKPGKGSFISGHNGRDTFEGASMVDLARNLTRITGLPVVDKTGLAGRYNFVLEYSRETSSGVPESSGGAGEIDTSAPSIFTALQEQLGLKLVAQKGPVQVLVVDHVEQPSAN